MPVDHLPSHPDLEHLKHQARALHRRLQAGVPDALAEVRALHPHPEPPLSLADAQLVVARRYGLASWPTLRRHVEVAVRPVRSRPELAAAFDLAGAQLAPPITSADRRFAALDGRYPQDGPLMLVAEHRGQLVGAALAFRQGDWEACGVTLRIIGLTPEYRRIGLGRRLVGLVEEGAVELRAGTIGLGAGKAVQGFYRRLGYTGRSMLHRQLPLRLRRP